MVANSSLTRGDEVVVGDSYPDEDLQGLTMIVASKGTVKCKGGKRCADEDRCNGEAVFVTTPDTFDPSPSGAGAWRNNTTKICLTHLKTTTGKVITAGNSPKKDVISEQEARTEPRPRALVKSDDGSRAATSTLPPPVIEEISDDEKVISVPPASVVFRLEEDGNHLPLEDLSNAVNSGDVQRIAKCVGLLKDENENLRKELIASQRYIISLLSSER